MSLKGLRFTLEVDGRGAGHLCSGEFQVNPEPVLSVCDECGCRQRFFYADGGDAAGEEGNADHLAGRHPAALCHRRGGRVWYAGEQRLADALSPAY